MSTYLVAFIVSNLVETENTQYVRGAGSPRVTIWTRSEVAEMTG